MSTPDQIKAAQAIKVLEDHMKTPLYTEQLKVLAFEKFERYKAFKAAGFTDEQALNLIKEN